MVMNEREDSFQGYNNLELSDDVPLKNTTHLIEIIESFFRIDDYLLSQKQFPGYLEKEGALESLMFDDSQIIQENKALDTYYVFSLLGFVDINIFSYLANKELFENVLFDIEKYDSPLHKEDLQNILRRNKFPRNAATSFNELNSRFPQFLNDIEKTKIVKFSELMSHLQKPFKHIFLRRALDIIEMYDKLRVLESGNLDDINLVKFEDSVSDREYMQNNDLAIDTIGFELIRMAHIFNQMKLPNTNPLTVFYNFAFKSLKNYFKIRVAKSLELYDREECHVVINSKYDYYDFNKQYSKLNQKGKDSFDKVAMGELTEITESYPSEDVETKTELLYKTTYPVRKYKK